MNASIEKSIPLSAFISPESFQNVITTSAFNGDAILMNVANGFTYHSESQEIKQKGPIRPILFIDIPDGEYIIDLAGGARNPGNRRQLTFTINGGCIIVTEDSASESKTFGNNTNTSNEKLTFPIEKLSISISPESFQNIITMKAFKADAILTNTANGFTYPANRLESNGRGSFRPVEFNVPDGEYMLDTAGGPRNPRDYRSATFIVSGGEII